MPLPHRVVPGEHLHCPLSQIARSAQRFPQPPQLRTSVFGSVQALLNPHLMSPPAQSVLQTPFLQGRPGAQAAPQLPQFRESVASFTQPESQRVSPAAQPQSPFAQFSPAAHIRPQAPQLVGSEATSTQLPPHKALP
jgi:hypothetical protein